MKVALNNQNVTNEQGINCQDCCFRHNLTLCYNLALRKHTICTKGRVLDNSKLSRVFVL